MNRVRTHGEWDFKNKRGNPFGRVPRSPSEYSRFFYYAGYGSKSYTHGKNMKNILCFDDPANLIYVATGIELFQPLGDGTFIVSILKWGAESYADKDDMPELFKKLPGITIRTWSYDLNCGAFYLRKGPICTTL
ncbi:MAG: hypothetical protein ACRCVN_02105 [Spirochaetia bacterium]